MNWGHGPPHSQASIRFCFAIVKRFLCLFFAHRLAKSRGKQRNWMLPLPQLFSESLWPTHQIFSILD
jgi:hypothetical protein